MATTHKAPSSQFSCGPPMVDCSFSSNTDKVVEEDDDDSNSDFESGCGRDPSLGARNTPRPHPFMASANRDALPFSLSLIGRATRQTKSFNTQRPSLRTATLSTEKSE